MKLIDLTGMIFGRLTVVHRSGASPQGMAKWLCQCSCGGSKEVVGGSLRRGATTSCGCYSKEVHKQSNSTHGLVKTPIYYAWKGMLGRCRDKHNKNYGGRGITVCEAWKDFTAFYNWAVSSGFQEGLTLERKKVNGNYEPANCTWIPRGEQSSNRTNTVKVMHNGELTPLSKVCVSLGLKYKTVMKRIYDGKTPEESIC